jgi:hypothetical protein
MRLEIDADFAAHQAFIETAFQLQPWETRPDAPEWLRNIRLVLNLHGQHWTGYTSTPLSAWPKRCALSLAAHIG